MSIKNEDLVDNWEEIDEDRLTSKLTRLRNESSQGTTTYQPEAITINGTSTAVDDEFRPKIIQRPMTILKRPSMNSDPKASGENKPKTQMKTLDQRKQEYAEARLRILGSAKSPDEEEDENKILNTNGFSISFDTPTQNQGILRMPAGPDGTIGFVMKR